MRKKTLKKISIVVALILALLFLGTLGKPAIIRSYIYTGIGNCKSIPVLCKLPEPGIIEPKVDQEYLWQLIPYTFDDMVISMPRGFTVVMTDVRKVYYKKWRRSDKGNVAYLLYRKPNFFINLFPNVVKQGVINDYDFIDHLRSARADTIENLTDAFFVVMKSIFTPDLGDQSGVKVVRFAGFGKRGFVSYNLGSKVNYFDCEAFSDNGDFFKVYIKDKTGLIDLEKVFTIISTIHRP